MVLPLKKIQLPENITSQAIPMLSDRQFVVDKTKLSAEEYKLQRELFWYREELFKSIRGHWREVCRAFLLSVQLIYWYSGDTGGWDSVRGTFIQTTTDDASYACDATYRITAHTLGAISSQQRNKR